MFFICSFLICENCERERNEIVGFISYIGASCCNRDILQFCIIMKVSAMVSSSGSGMKLCMKYRKVAGF